MWISTPPITRNAFTNCAHLERIAAVKEVDSFLNPQAAKLSALTGFPKNVNCPPSP
jgi:hypothetical protein